MAAVDWRLVPAAILILFALWILAALALACSTRVDMIPTLAICSAIFLLGIMSDYLFGTARGERLVVGVRSLHGDAKLAAFLARGRAGNGQEHVSLGIMLARPSAMSSAMWARRCASQRSFSKIAN